ncbi:diguanylate cyclase domain-containing protein [Pseudomonadota bacterium]
MNVTLTSRVVAIVIVIFLVLVALTGLNMRHDYTNALSGAHNATRHQSQLYAEHAARSFETVDLILRRVVDGVERDMTDMPRAPETVQADLKELTELAPQLRALVISDGDGLQTASNTGRGTGKVTIADRGYFKAHKADPNLGLLIDKPLRGKVTGNWFLSISRRVDAPDGSFAGVVVAVVSQGYFNEFYQTADDRENLSTALVNADGLIFAFSSRFAPGGLDVAGETLAETPLFAEHLSANRSGSFEGQVFTTDQQRIVSFQRVEDQPVVIVTSIPRDQAFAAMSLHMRTIVAFIAATAVVLAYLLITTIRQVSQREKTERQLRHMANHDLLTNLPNRRQGMEYLSRAVATSRRHVTQVGILFIDLDGFKDVNDRYGHKAGDQVLIETAERFNACVRETDVVARLGGDEFLIVLSDVTDDHAVTRIAQLILEAAARPHVIGDNEAQLSASIGIAFYPHHGDAPDDLIKMADNAMYQAKDAGKNNYCVAGV